MTDQIHRIKLSFIFPAIAVFMAAMVTGCFMSGDKAVSKSERSPDLATGKKAPDFTLKDQDGQIVSLKDLTSASPVLIAFYPKDNSPVCTMEMKEFRDMYDQYRALGVQIIGISTNDIESHKKFKNKNQLPFPLLSDQSTQVSRAYGVFDDQKGTSRRSYFLVDANGGILYRFVEKRQIQKRKKDELIAAVKKSLKQDM